VTRFFIPELFTIAQFQAVPLRPGGALLLFLLHSIKQRTYEIDSCSIPRNIPERFLGIGWDKPSDSWESQLAVEFVKAIAEAFCRIWISSFA
jgi:hypothetical protein